MLWRCQPEQKSVLCFVVAKLASGECWRWRRPDVTSDWSEVEGLGTRKGFCEKARDAEGPTKTARSEQLTETKETKRTLQRHGGKGKRNDKSAKQDCRFEAGLFLYVSADGPRKRLEDLAVVRGRRETELSVVAPTGSYWTASVVGDWRPSRLA